MSNLIIAIDGPAGAGKSTVAKALAKRLGLRYLDTGAMYRALALKASRLGCGPNEGDRAAEICHTTEISFAEPITPDGPQRVLLDNEDVTAEIRKPEIGELASALSAFPAVRRELVDRQKKIVAEGGYTLEGRDTTTVVAPDADLKVFLTASLEERAKRRMKDMEDQGIHISYEELLRQIAERDHRDYTRADSPLKLGDKTHLVESFGIPPDEVVEKIVLLLPTASSR